MSARWRRSSKSKKWLDLNELDDKQPKIPQTVKRTKTVPSHTSFRPSKRFSKKGLTEQKPLIDIFQENTTVTIVAEIVGFNKDSLKINVKDQKLTLSAKSKDRRYYKSLNLPTVVIPTAMHTKFKNGVLEIKLKKAETLNKEADQNAT
jgi:HSP20 family molecular chaperone IbpA